MALYLPLGAPSRGPEYVLFSFGGQNLNLTLKHYEAVMSMYTPFWTVMSNYSHLLSLQTKVIYCGIVWNF